MTLPMEADAEVTVKVLFFARARELTGLGEATCEITANITPQNLLEKIVSTFSLEAIAQNLILSVNEEWVSGTTSLGLQTNDVIAVIPPLSGVSDREGSGANGWTEQETNYLMDRYHDFVDNVGPMRQFRTKKIMWTKIAAELSDVFSTTKTAIQVENRYKTVMRRKASFLESKRIVRTKPPPLESDEEYPILKRKASSGNKIPHITMRSAKFVDELDDSIEGPEILLAPGERVIRKKMKDKKRADKKDLTALLGTLRQLHAEKEANRERRHREKMELLLKLVGK